MKKRTHHQRETRASSQRSTRAKYEELQYLGKASYVSQRGLNKLLNSIRQNGLPESFSRATQYRSKKDVARTETPYGPLVIEQGLELGRKKEQLTLGFQNPLAFIHYHCSRSPHYATIVQSAMEKHPCVAGKPWHIVLYQDEIDPSDALGKHKSRNIVAYYWAILEFGAEALCHEQVWGTVVTMRSQKANLLNGGFTELTDMVFQQFYGDTFDVRRSGVIVEFDGSQQMHLFMKVAILLADEPALKQMIGCKGHAGTKCCLLCANGTHPRPPGGAKPWHEQVEYWVPIDNPDITKFEAQTYDSIKQCMCRLKELHDNGDTSLKLFEQGFGFIYSPLNIISNTKYDIGIATATMFDWCHVYCSSGLADAEFGEFMQKMKRLKGEGITGCRYGDFFEYASTWAFPRQRANSLHMLDDAYYHNWIRSGDFPCTASEMLTLGPLLRRWLSQVMRPCAAIVNDTLVEHVDSLIACLDTLDMMNSLKTGAGPTPAKLAEAISNHLHLFLKCYGRDAMRQKHHYALHLPMILKEWGILLSVFTQERKHRAVLRYTRNRTIGRSFELGVIEDITCHNIWELGLPFTAAYSTSIPKGAIKLMLREMYPDQPIDAVTLHREISLNGGSAVNGDVVSLDFDGKLEVGELVVTVGINRDGEKYLESIVSIWEIQAASDDRTSLSVLVRDNPRRVPTATLHSVFTYHKSDDGHQAMLLIPFECRVLF